tara:strand:+ start:19 stop:2082 length:2064 start_codon:yes stop_codon:yes gene_type:complete
MAKRFGGFTPEQMGKIIPEMQGMDAEDQAKFLASQPGASAVDRITKMAMLAQERMNMAYGGMVKRKGYAEGGFTSAVNTAQATVSANRNALSAAQQALAVAPEDAAAKTALQNAQLALTRSEAALSTSMQNLQNTTTAPEATAAGITDPLSLTTKAEVSTPSDTAKAEGEIAPTVGQQGQTTEAVATPAVTAPTVAQPAATAASTFAATTVSADVKDTLAALTSATGKPSAEALAEAATMTPETLAQLGLTAAQITEAQRVQAPAARKAETGELIEGSTVDMDRVRTETNFEAATGAPSTDATVQGQLTALMAQFEGNEPPAWAAGAMRAATAQMAARGLAASSMAGQAIVQAAMESALPIAVQDSQTSAQFELTNLSNRQQSAMFAAEKRAEFLNLEFTQEFQTRVTNAAKISDIANMNFSADVQIALENAQLAQSVDLSNLSAKNAKILADSAAMTQLDMTNLNNRQQAGIQAASAFMNMDMRNLDNEQQTSMFKTQEMVNSMLSDQAAENASKQFNSTSENQTNQFFSSLASQISQFNSEQSNAMNRFNSGESNALAQFNAVQENARDQFNAQNHLVVAQANAKWFQTITTTENAADNQANRDEVLAANALTTTAYNNLVQRERDLLAWAWQSSENSLSRDGDIATAKISAEASSGSDTPDALSTASGKFLSAIATAAANVIFS